MEGVTTPPSDVEDLPSGTNDPGDPLRPELEEENATPTPPAGAPQQDMEATEEAELPNDDDGDLSDDSALSDVDEAAFEEFNEEALNIEDRPVAVDESNVALLGVHRRKRGEGDDDSRRKPRKKLRKRAKDTAGAPGDGEGEIRRSEIRRSEKRERRKPTPEDEDTLTPDERRKRALDRAMDEALKGPAARRKKKGGIDLVAMADAEIEDLRRRMADAAKADNDARERGQPAVRKLKMLPEVVGMLSRNNIRSSLVDPDINLLESVRFFLEPLNDGSMPAYNIQRELFSCLEKLPMSKECLIASRLGMIIRFYPKSPIVEPRIKQQAERFLLAWTRIVLGQQADYRRRPMQTASYDPNARELPIRNDNASSQAAVYKAQRERQLANPQRANRAAAMEGPGSYSIAPQSNLADLAMAPQGGSQAEAFFKRIRARKVGDRS